ncbi:unnamed protein product [Oppiella nova]|uniref:Uncharacterized protein n=1 Tax=Oppiella nova TaxID=334625 RepID=A0A7R9MMF4_9ACAR|nr:unnamed protein product [Oppiella nova]CAG2178916.1 unnamed protein product [Oppiella nova]
MHSFLYSLWTTASPSKRSDGSGNSYLSSRAKTTTTTTTTTRSRSPSASSAIKTIY